MYQAETFVKTFVLCLDSCGPGSYGSSFVRLYSLRHDLAESLLEAARECSPALD